MGHGPRPLQVHSKSRYTAIPAIDEHREGGASIDLAGRGGCRPLVARACWGV